jgi:hypothetical protein
MTPVAEITTVERDRSGDYIRLTSTGDLRWRPRRPSRIHEGAIVQAWLEREPEPVPAAHVVVLYPGGPAEKWVT